MNKLTKPIILGSSSQTRFDLLSRLGLPFSVVSPDIDESPLPDEPPQELVLRLARQKAYRVAEKISQSSAIIISSDELLVNLSKDPSKTMGKPNTKERAISQLMESRDCLLCFYTSLCVYDYDNSGEGALHSDVIPTKVKFRDFCKTEVKRVVEIDNPLSCAGAFRSEGLSVSLCEQISEQEPGALMGLPLITLSHFLRNCQ
jgi:septum formation protein